jgi:nucleoside-diphosphate kinase
LIKPHAIKERNAGKILRNILSEGFEVSAMQMFYLDHPSVDEFLEVYQGVIPNFSRVCEVLTTGPLIALEIR